MVLGDRTITESAGFCSYLFGRPSVFVCHASDSVWSEHTRDARHGLRFFGHLLLGLRSVRAVGAQKLGTGRPINPQTSAQEMHTIQQELPSLVRTRR